MSIVRHRATPSAIIKAMLTLAEVKPGDIVYDIGSGEGKILIIATLEFGARCVGIEIDETLYDMSKSRINELGLDIQVIHGDMMSINLSPADVVVMYLSHSANEVVRPKLEEELRPGTRVVSYVYPIQGWESKTDYPIYLYVVD